MRSWTFLVAATLAAAFRLEGQSLHRRADNDLVHVGYRTMSTAEVEAIQKNNYRAVVSLGTEGTQLGPGTYITPGFMQWGVQKPGVIDAADDKWDCIVMMDADAWNGLKKVWIPKMFNFQEEGEECVLEHLWTPRKPRPANKEKFIKLLIGEPYTSADVMQFSLIISHEDTMQGVIPSSTVRDKKVHINKCAKRNTPEHPLLNHMKPSTVDWYVQSMKGWGLGPHR